MIWKERFASTFELAVFPGTCVAVSVFHYKRSLSVRLSVSEASGIPVPAGIGRGSLPVHLVFQNFPFVPVAIRETAAMDFPGNRLA